VRRPTLLHAAFAAALTFLAACDDGSRPTAPAASPAPRAALSSAPVCGREDARLLQQGISTLFADAQLRRDARTAEGVVESRCTSAVAQAYPAAPADPAATVAATLATAPAAALQYAEWLLARRAAGQVGGGDAFFWGYLRRLIGYVGYTLPTSPLALDATGFIRVCESGNVCQAESPDGQKGIRFTAFALSAYKGIPFLVTGVPVECSPFSESSSYSVYGRCVDISVDPKRGTSFTLNPQDPGTVVEVCADHQRTPTYVYARRQDVYSSDIVTQGKLGQRSELAAGFTPISFRPYPGFSILAKVPADLADPDWCVTPRTSAPAGSAGAFGALRQAGDAVLALFRPQIAYAGHGGLTTLPGAVSALSVFGPLDGYAFNGTFERDPIGAFPADTAAEMRGGAWSFKPFPDPSRVSVQSSDIFTGKYVLLNQGGGAAGSKDALTFGGVLAKPLTTADGDTNRVVRLRLRAAVLSSRAFDTQFEVRSLDSTLLASIRYVDGAFAKSGTLRAVLPAGAVASVAPATAPWGQNAVQPLEVTVAFSRDSKTARVTVRLVNGAVLAQYTLPATDVARFSWVLSGRDGQAIGSDDYQVFDVTGEDDVIRAN
jgi:hypothetical protein